MKAEDTSICFRELADLHWPRRQQGSPPSDFLKSTRMHAESSNGTGPMFQTTETSEMSTASRQTSSPAVSRANHSVTPGSVEARQITVTSGLKCCALLERQDPLGCSVRTLLASSRWNSTIALLTWKRKVTPAGRLLFRLAPSTRNTAGTECGLSGIGLWATPTTQEADSDCKLTASGRKKSVDGRDSRSLSLGRQVKLWATPRAGESKQGPSSTEKHLATGDWMLSDQVKTGIMSHKEAVAVKLWPTPRGSKVAASITMQAALNRIKKTGYHANLEEAVAMKLWPTPRASDFKGSGPEGSKSQKYMKDKHYLCAMVATPQSGQLNPVWVEWLMGYPIGHTDCEHLEMQSSPKSRSKSSKP